MLPARKNQDWLPSIFNDFFGNEWLVKPNFSTPAINVVETEKEYRVEVAAPGMTKDDFKINLDDENNLTINVEKKEEKTHDRNTQETGFGKEGIPNDRCKIIPGSVLPFRWVSYRCREGRSPL